MKRLLLPIFVLFVKVSLGQTNYYSFNADSLYSENRIRSVFETIQNTLPDNNIMQPTVYHRVIKKDSIINYFSFVIQRSDKKVIKQNFEIVFKQDSLFLLLNKKLPMFELKDLNGKVFSSSQLMGKPTLLNYWAIYCTPCVAEFPQLDELREKYKNKMNFIAIAENTCVNDDLKSFLEKHPFNFTVLENGQEYKRTLKIGAIPRNIFIDKNGYIRYIQGNFPYEAINLTTGDKKYRKDNFFVKIIEELIKE